MNIYDPVTFTDTTIIWTLQFLKSQQPKEIIKTWKVKEERNPADVWVNVNRMLFIPNIWLQWMQHCYKHTEALAGQWTPLKLFEFPYQIIFTFESFLKTGEEISVVWTKKINFTKSSFSQLKLNSNKHKPDNRKHWAYRRFQDPWRAEAVGSLLECPENLWRFPEAVLRSVRSHEDMEETVSTEFLWFLKKIKKFFSCCFTF